MTSTLIHLQFPINDLRYFAAGDSQALLHVKKWQPGREEKKEYVRSTGGISNRKEAGHWRVTDQRFCDARRAIRFDMASFDAAGLAEWKLKVEFRRLHIRVVGMNTRHLGLMHFQDPVPGAVHFDVGLSTSARFDRTRIDEFLERLLSLRVRVARSGAGTVTCSLHEAGKHLSRLYAETTVRHRTKTRMRRKEYAALASFVTCGRPAIFVEAAEPQLSPETLPKQATPLELAVNHARLFDLPIAHKGNEISGWVLIRSPGVTGAENFAQRLRSSQLGYYAQLQTLVHALQAVTEGIKPPPWSPGAQSFQKYLVWAFEKLNKSQESLRKQGNDPAAIAIAAAAESSFQIETVLEQLGPAGIDARDDVILKTKSWAESNKGWISSDTGVAAPPTARTLTAGFICVSCLCFLLVFPILPGENRRSEEVEIVVLAICAMSAWAAVDGVAKWLKFKWFKLYAYGAAAIFFFVYISQHLSRLLDTLKEQAASIFASHWWHTVVEFVRHQVGST
jgi:hypothetical protein